jgi:hypothetical protein
VRDNVAKLALISEHADQKIVLAGLRADQQAKTACAESSESDPVAPGQLCPFSFAFIPMQDNCGVGLPAIGFSSLTFRRS